MKISKPSILIIDDDRIPLTLAVIRCLGISREVKIHVLTLSGKRYPVFRFSKYVSSFHSVNVQNDEDALNAIIEAANLVKADVLIPIRETTTMLISTHLNDFNTSIQIPQLPQPAILELVRNKWLLYQWLYKNKFTNEKPLRYSDLIKKPDLLKKLSYPFLIKPFLEAGGTGITVIRNEDEFNKYMPPVICKPEELLIQSYIPGFDIDFSGYMKNGKVLAFSIQKGNESVEKFVYSHKIQFVHNNELRKTAAAIMQELKYSGIAHLDFRFDKRDNTYKLVDFNPRFWRSIMGSVCAGINFPMWIMKHILHEDLSIQTYKNIEYSAEMNFLKLARQGKFLNKSDFMYSLKDPMPLFAEILLHLSYLNKRS